jgi:hypothetical protein
VKSNLLSAMGRVRLRHLFPWSTAADAIEHEDAIHAP